MLIVDVKCICSHLGAVGVLVRLLTLPKRNRFGQNLECTWGTTAGNYSKIGEIAPGVSGLYRPKTFLCVTNALWLFEVYPSLISTIFETTDLNQCTVSVRQKFPNFCAQGVHAPKMPICGVVILRDCMHGVCSSNGAILDDSNHSRG